MENSINNYLSNKNDEYKQIKIQYELLKSQDINTKLKRIKTNILKKDEINAKIHNKRTKLNNLGNSIFSNMEINKFINESNKTNKPNISDYFTKKIENRKSIGIQSELDNQLYLSNRKPRKDLYSKGKIELKDESTNTHINYYDCGKSHSFESNRNNIFEKKNFYAKTPMNKRNNKINIEFSTKTFNKNNRKTNYINKISINNNIKFENETNKNNYKYYLELYKFYLIQSVIQNRGKYFNLKNKNSNDNKIKIPNPLLLLRNTKNNIEENNKCSLRELYRYLNYDKLRLSLYQLSQTKNNKFKKGIKKTNEKKTKKQSNIFNRNNNQRLMNVQYNIDEYLKNKNQEKNKFFQKTLFEKRIININKRNNKNYKDENKTDYHGKNFIKTSKNFRNNKMKEKYSPIKDDIFYKGIFSLSPDIKSNKNVHLKKVKKIYII